MNMKLNQTFAKALVVFFMSAAFLTSCSDSDDAPTINLPEVTYANTNLEAIFFNAGSSSVPTVNWGGNEGSFALATTISGISIDEATGVISWTKDLPIGTYNIDVLAANSAGPTTVELTINNPLQGLFIGTYMVTNDDTAYPWELELNADNTAVITQSNGMDEYDSLGTWTMNGSTINIDYTSSLTNNDISFSGLLTTGTEATYSGDWFNGHGGVSGTEGGTFEVELQ